MLLYTINRFLQRSGMPPTRFGRLAANDPRLVGDLANGREPGAKLSARVLAFIAEQEQRP